MPIESWNETEFIYFIAGCELVMKLRNETQLPKSPTDSPNGFTFAEVLSALLIMSLLIAGFLEVLRLTINYRSRLEASSTRIQSSLSLANILRREVSGGNSENIRVSPNQITIFGSPNVGISLSKTAYHEGHVTSVTVTNQNRGKAKIISQKNLPGIEPNFIVKSDRNGRISSINVEDNLPSKFGPSQANNLIAVIPIYATADRPCVFDSVSSRCRTETE